MKVSMVLVDVGDGASRLNIDVTKYDYMYVYH